MNTGHTVQCSVLEGTRMFTKGAPANGDEYVFSQFHLHWGNETRGGSEHTVLGMHYQAELHIVHVNTKHSKLPFTEIIKKSDGVLAVGVFIDFANLENGKTPNSEFSKLMRAVMDVRDKPDLKVNLTRGYLSLDALLPADRASYTTYLGGITTPTCNGATTWVVYKEPLYVSKDELAFLYKVMDEEHEPIINNYRPVQEIGNRTVRASYRDATFSSAPCLAATYTALITTLAWLFSKSENHFSVFQSKLQPDL